MSDAEEILHTLSVQPPQAGLRLDKWLAGQLPDISRSRLQALIAQGYVEDDTGPVEDAADKVRPGEIYLVTIPAAEPAIPQPEDIPLEVRYEDDHLIVVEKPAGMVTHPAAGNSAHTLVNALLHHCAASLSGIGGVKRPGIVHRLDKDTSGLMVAAKTDKAHHALAAQFAAHSIARAYRALCWGVPSPARGEITGNIGRHPTDRKRMAVVGRGGKEALTRYEVRSSFQNAVSLVECRLATGRTHQIRVHMTSIGHPLVGDPVYGRGKSHKIKGFTDEQAEALIRFPRQALHAFQLGFSHPESGEWLEFFSELPSDFNELIKLLEFA
ncbi:ribosomal large subunit pseudouridine synthase D [mine drainage metagenome]|uniref:Ribosomal large subunit pseudouridine synthase D n=1 Tax=mine drainage metagenome TaxID=410659 RepID=A0A1J5RE49_9ZZZZ